METKKVELIASPPQFHWVGDIFSEIIPETCESAVIPIPKTFGTECKFPDSWDGVIKTSVKPGAFSL